MSKAYALFKRIRVYAKDKIHLRGRQMGEQPYSVHIVCVLVLKEYRLHFVEFRYVAALGIA